MLSKYNIYNCNTNLFTSYKLKFSVGHYQNTWKIEKVCIGMRQIVEYQI